MRKTAKSAAAAVAVHLPHSGIHPRAVAILAAEAEASERPFEEGVNDGLDADLRHRLVSEAAFEIYRQRGFVDGYDLDDWLAAEAQIDHLLLHGMEDQVGSG